jgi:hypothetical protein
MLIHREKNRMPIDKQNKTHNLQIQSNSCSLSYLNSSPKITGSLCMCPQTRKVTRRRSPSCHDTISSSSSSSTSAWALGVRRESDKRLFRREEEERGKEGACGLLVWGGEMGLKKKEEEKRIGRDGERLGSVGLKSERSV